MRTVVNMPVRDMEYTEVVPDEPSQKKEQEHPLKTVRKICRRIIRASFFFPAVMGISAVALFVNTARRYGLHAAMAGAKKAEKAIEPLAVRKRQYKKKLKHHNRRIVLTKLLSTKQFKKTSQYRALIKIMQLYKPEKPVKTK